MATMTKPATGWVRWKGFAPNGDRVLEICPEGTADEDATTYEVETMDGGGYNLYSQDKKTWEIKCYKVRPVKGHPKCFTCDCPDATHRRQYVCKHVRGLKAGLGKLAQTEPF